MTDERLTFTLYGENEIVSIDAFVDVVRRVSDLVQGIQQAATKSRTRRTWIVERLQSSSPTITLRPAVVLEQPVVPIVIDGIRELTSGVESPSLPPVFGEDALKDVGGMRRMLSSRGGLVKVAFYTNGSTAAAPAAEIDDHIGDQVDRVLLAGYEDLGTVEGTLGAIQTHRGRYFTVWDDVTGAPVRCRLSDEKWWRHQVTTLLESRVVVRGRVRYFGNGTPRSVEPEEIFDLAPADTGARATFGSIPGIIGEEDAVDYVRRIRQ